MLYAHILIFFRVRFAGVFFAAGRTCVCTVRYFYFDWCYFGSCFGSGFVLWGRRGGEGGSFVKKTSEKHNGHTLRETATRSGCALLSVRIFGALAGTKAETSKKGTMLGRVRLRLVCLRWCSTCHARCRVVANDDGDSITSREETSVFFIRDPGGKHRLKELAKRYP